MRFVRHAGRSGLTRAETIVILVVGLTLLGLLLTLLPRAQEDSNRVQCIFHLKQIGGAVQRYHQRTKYLPAARIAAGYATWAVQIAPDLRANQAGPLGGWDLQQSYYAQPEAVRTEQIPVLYCPARRHPPQLSIGEVMRGAKQGGFFPGALGDYACAAGNGDPNHPWDGPNANGPIILGEVLERKGDLILRWRSRTSLEDLKDRTSYVILLGDKHVPAGKWGQPVVGDGSIYNGDYPANAARVGGPGHGIAPTPDAPFDINFGSYHVNGVCQFVFADNSVRARRPDIDVQVLGRLTTRGPAEKQP